MSVYEHSDTTEEEQFTQWSDGTTIYKDKRHVKISFPKAKGQLKKALDFSGSWWANFQGEKEDSIEKIVQSILNKNSIAKSIQKLEAILQARLPMA